MNADHETLASAYLDGELTAEERRIADTDPAVMAEVARLRALRAELAAVTPPTDAVRERSIAAAMAVFEELHRSPAAIAPAPTRRRPANWLGVAAAVLTLGVLGTLLAIGVRGRGDDDDSAAEEPAAEEPAAEEPAAEVFSEVPASDELARITEATDLDAADTLAGEGQAEEPAEQPAAEEPASEESASEPAPQATLDVAAVNATDAARHLDGLVITTREQLAAVGRHLLGLIDTHQLPPTPEHACPFPDVLADGIYGELPPTEVFIAVDTANRRVIAIATATCEIVEESPLP